MASTGAVVVALKIRGLLTHVRHVHPATGRITTSWIETSQLEDPFSSQPDALSRKVKYSVQPLTKAGGRRLAKEISIESVKLLTGPGLSDDIIQAINAKLGSAVTGFRGRAAECGKWSQGHPWSFESKLAKVVISRRYLSVVFATYANCGGTPDFEREAFVFARASGKLIPPDRLLKEVFPREEIAANKPTHWHLIKVNDNLAEAMMNDNADSLGACDERCDYDVRNKSYHIWMEDGQMVFFPEFSQTMAIKQKEYVVRVRDK